MGIVVVGGHTRNIGKTTLTEMILRATSDLDWTAMKITQFGHGVCSANGESCDCETADHTIAVSEEKNRVAGTDTARMVAAGAARVFWVRTRQGQLAEAMPVIRRRIADSTHVLLESNSILRFLRPDLYFAVLDDSITDFKPSALRYLDRADALFTPEGSRPDARTWKIAPGLIACKPVFSLAEELPSEVIARLRLTGRKGPAEPDPLPAPVAIP